MTDSLVQRLRAAIDAEEARAHALPPFPWKLNPEDDTEVFAADDVVLAEAWALSTNQQRLVAAFIADNDPKATLRRCAADRKILDLHDPTIKTHDVYRNGVRTGEVRTDYHCCTCGGRDWDLDPIGDKPCDTLLALAEAYSVEA